MEVPRRPGQERLLASFFFFLTYIREGKISIRSLPDILRKAGRLGFPPGKRRSNHPRHRVSLQHSQLLGSLDPVELLSGEPEKHFHFRFLLAGTGATRGLRRNPADGKRRCPDVEERGRGTAPQFRFAS